MVKTKNSKTGDLIIVFVCILLILACLLPMLNVLARSLSSSEALIRNQVMLWPKGWNLSAYKLVLTDQKYTWSLCWTAMLTAICTVVSMVMTVLCAYPLTYSQLKGRRLFNTLI